MGRESHVGASPESQAGPGRTYVGVGIETYAHTSFKHLPRAVKDVEEVADVLAKYGYTSHVIRDPGEEEVRPRLRSLLPRDGIINGGSLIVHWAGHGEPSHEGRLRLITSDSVPGDDPNVTPETVAGIAARTGASQILILFDTCYSGLGVMPALSDADRVVTGLPPDAPSVWLGVLASALELEEAVDGVFASLLLKLLREGPTDPGLQFRWSAHNTGFRGDDLADALVKEWGESSQKPKFAYTGDAGDMFPNRRHNPSAAEQVVEHLLLAARGTETVDEGSYFSGRVGPLEQVVGWMGNERPGLFVVTGPPGSGKSALVGRIASLSNPTERASLLTAGQLRGPDPQEGSVHAHVHARGLTPDLLVEAIDEQLVSHGVLPPTLAGHRNRLEVLGALERTAPPVVVVDGLDEAEAEAWRIAEEVLLPMSGVARVLVATRDLSSALEGSSLVQSLMAADSLDLAEEWIRAQTELDVRDYVAKRLADVGEQVMDTDKIAEAVLNLATIEGEGAFLLARVITAQLRAEPIDTSLPDWETALARSVEDAFERDLSAIAPMMRDGTPVPQAARELLEALAWGYGAGLPDDVWPVVATALSRSGTTYTRADTFWALGQGGRYIVEGGEGGRATYRLSHIRLAQHLRSDKEFTAGLDGEGTRAAVLADSLIAYYVKLLSRGIQPRDPLYLWRYSFRHAADAGLAGIGYLHRLMERLPIFLVAVASGLDHLVTRYGRLGRRKEALRSAEEAVRAYRDLAARDPAFLPGLADGLRRVASCQIKVGRRREAVEAHEEAAGIYRELAASNVVFLPELGRTLMVLSNEYRHLGRVTECVRMGDEAVRILRDSSAVNPAALPSLAAAIVVMGIAYADLGWRDEALAAADEAVKIDRDVAATNPGALHELARMLWTAGIIRSAAGRPKDALDAAKEAVRINRDLAAADPIFVRSLAVDLCSLSIRYSEMGDWKLAEAPAEEAVQIQRPRSTVDAEIVELARMLATLGLVYAHVGRDIDAIEAVNEAIETLRNLSRDNSGFLPDFADILGQASKTFGQLGRLEEAVGRAEESVQIHRDLAHMDPAAIQGLVRALSNLGARLQEVGRSGDVDAAWEAVVGSLTRERDRALLLLGRADVRAGDRSIEDLIEAERLLRDEGDDLLQRRVHASCRARRTIDPNRFDAVWRTINGTQPPAWLLVDENHLNLTWTWLNTEPADAEKQFLVTNQEKLLSTATEAAVDELGLPPNVVEHVRDFLQRARHVGIDEAYRPVFAEELLWDWVQADLEGKNSMLVGRRIQLLGEDVTHVLRMLRREDPEDQRLIAHEALLTLARAGREDVAFHAMAEPGQFPTLLADLARIRDIASLQGMAELASADPSDSVRASGFFYKAIALALSNNPDAALNAVRQAGSMHSEQVPAWLGLLVELAATSPQVLPLSEVLLDSDT